MPDEQNDAMQDDNQPKPPSTVKECAAEIGALASAQGTLEERIDEMTRMINQLMSHPINNMSIRSRFMAHQLTEGQQIKVKRITEASTALAQIITDIVPNCEDRRQAVDLVLMAKMRAVLAIAAFGGDGA